MFNSNSINPPKMDLRYPYPRPYPNTNYIASPASGTSNPTINFPGPCPPAPVPLQPQSAQPTRITTHPQFHHGAIASLGRFQSPLSQIIRATSTAALGPGIPYSSKPYFADTPCKFFTFGACRKGDSCLYSHAQPQIQLQFRAPLPAPVKGMLENRSGSVPPFIPAAAAAVQKQIKVKQQEINDKYKANLKYMAEEMQNDMKTWTKSNVWKLSSYGLPSSSSVDGLRDKSPEEVRWQIMKSKMDDDENGNGYELRRLINFHQTGKRQREIYANSTGACANAIKKTRAYGISDSSDDDELFLLTQELDKVLQFKLHLSFEERVKMFSKDMFGTDTLPDFCKGMTKENPIRSVADKTKAKKNLLSSWTSSPQPNQEHALTKTKLKVEDCKDVLSETFMSGSKSEELAVDIGDGDSKTEMSLSSLRSPRLVSLINAAMSPGKFEFNFEHKVRDDGDCDHGRKLELEMDQDQPEEQEYEDPEPYGKFGPGTKCLSLIGRAKDIQKTPGIWTKDDMTLSPIFIDPPPQNALSPRPILTAVRKSPKGPTSTSTPKGNFDESSFQEFYSAIEYNDSSFSVDENILSSQVNLLEQDSSYISSTSEETGTTEYEINTSLEVSSCTASTSALLSSPSPKRGTGSDSETSKPRKKKFFRKSKSTSNSPMKPSSVDKDKCIMQ